MVVSYTDRVGGKTNLSTLSGVRKSWFPVPFVFVHCGPMPQLEWGKRKDTYTTRSVLLSPPIAPSDCWFWFIGKDGIFCTTHPNDIRILVLFLSARPDTGISSEPYLLTSEFFLFSERTQHTLLKRINTFRPTFTDASRRPVRPPTTQPVLGAEYSGVRWWREGSWCGSE